MDVARRVITSLIVITFSGITYYIWRSVFPIEIESNVIDLSSIWMMQFLAMFVIDIQYHRISMERTILIAVLFSLASTTVMYAVVYVLL
jgi:hypothetical protein